MTTDHSLSIGIGVFSGGEGRTHAAISAKPAGTALPFSTASAANSLSRHDGTRFRCPQAQTVVSGTPRAFATWVEPPSSLRNC
jgi:hypothetical protein